MKVDLYIEDKKIDLFNDENVQITSAVATIEDITKNVTDYSKDFTVPASKNNNKIFKHYYNATIDNTFDARTKVKSTIKINNVTFKEGKIKLSKVKVKDNKPYSYTLNFFGNLLSLPKILDKDLLSNLDLSAFDHESNSTNVLNGLTTSLFNGDLVYNLFVKKQLYYNSDVLDTTNTEGLTNIAYQSGTGDNGIEWSELRPSIKLIKIIEAIENDYGLTFSRDFFGRSEFQNLFLWLNNTEEKVAGGDTQIVDWNSGSSEKIDLTTNKGIFEITADNLEWDLTIGITPSVGFENTPYTVKFYKDGALTRTTTISNGGASSTKDNLNTQGASGSNVSYEVYYEVQSPQNFKYTSQIIQEYNLVIGFSSNLVTYNTFASENTIVSEIKIREELPKIKIIDFLKGLFKMFKLVIIPTGENSLYVNTINDFYKNGSVYDVTKYIDFNSYSVSRGNLLSEINYQFKEPKTILNKKFEENNNKFYGDLEAKILEDPTNLNSGLIDGKKKEYKVPFEQFIYERLPDLEDNSLTNIMYASIVDESVEPVNPSAHIFYNNNISVGAKTVGFIDDLDNKVEISTTINTPAHTIDLGVNSNYSTVFGNEINEWDGTVIENTIFKNYHKDYIEGIFNVKRRDFNYKAQLPYYILGKLQLNDILKIKENYYRINKYTTSLTTGKVSLDLFNAFDNKIKVIEPTTRRFFVSNRPQKTSTYLSNSENATINKVAIQEEESPVDLTWVTVTQTDSNIFFEFEENATGNPRNMYVNITVTGKNTIQIYLKQEA